MVMTASALASSSWATMVLSRLGFAGLAAFGALRFATALGFAVLLRAAVFLVGAFRGLVLFCQARPHQVDGRFSRE
jgi:hypothetical protein